MNKYYHFSILIWFTRFCKHHLWYKELNGSPHLSPWKLKSAGRARDEFCTVFYLHSRHAKLCLASWYCLCSSDAPRGWNVILPEGWSPGRCLTEPMEEPVSVEQPSERGTSWRQREKVENLSWLRNSLDSCKGIWTSRCINQANCWFIPTGFVNVCALIATFC